MSQTNNRLPLWKKNTAVNGDFEPYLEHFLLDDKPDAGLVLVLPGGGYILRADHEGAPVAEKFNQLGLHSAVLQYRVAPRKYPDALLDTLRAVQMLRLIAHTANAFSGKIAVLGFSAGGHLAACSGTLYRNIEVIANDPADNMDHAPDALVLCYPVISSGVYGHQQSFEALAGNDGELKEYLSLEKRVSKDTPPAFLWHTAEDDTVPVENSLMFVKAMRECNRPVELHVFPEGRHGLGLAPDYSARIWPELAAAFLQRNGF